MTRTFETLTLHDKKGKSKTNTISDAARFRYRRSFGVRKAEINE